METYRERAKRLATRTTKPSLTDQSMAKDTDLNVIVGKFLKGHPAPGSARTPIHGADLYDFPTDLREAIEMARSLDEKRAQLPEQLRDMPMEQLMVLNRDELTRILTPPATPPEPKE